MIGGKYWEDGSQGEQDGGERAYGCYDLNQSSYENVSFSLCIKQCACVNLLLLYAINCIHVH